MAELEGAVDRTAEKYQEAADEKPEPPAAPPGA
jgi:hypothetical protein